MKKINTMQDALAFQLQALMYAETRIKAEFSSYGHRVNSQALAEEIRHYAESAENKATKLERIFNYLLVETLSRKHETIDQLLKEVHCVLTETASARLKDILMINCMQTINAYKTAAYRNACMLANELELDIAIDLLEQILHWELKSGQALSALAIQEFNKVQQSLKK